MDKLNVIGSCNLLYNASLMVEKEIGYALCIDQLINTTGCSQLCFRPLEPKLTVDIHLVCKRYQIFSKAADICLQRMKLAFPQYPPNLMIRD